MGLKEGDRGKLGTNLAILGLFILTIGCGTSSSGGRGMGGSLAPIGSGGNGAPHGALTEVLSQLKAQCDFSRGTATPVRITTTKDAVGFTNGTFRTPADWTINGATVGQVVLTAGFQTSGLEYKNYTGNTIDIGVSMFEVRLNREYLAQPCLHFRPDDVKVTVDQNGYRPPPPPVLAQGQEETSPHGYIVRRPDGSIWFDFLRAKLYRAGTECTPPGDLPNPELARAIYDLVYRANNDDLLAIQMALVASMECGDGYCNKVNASNDLGPLQINLYWQAELIKEMGYNPSDMAQVVPSVKVALRIFEENGNWNRWLGWQNRGCHIGGSGSIYPKIHAQNQPQKSKNRITRVYDKRYDIHRNRRIAS
ncbi:MAG: hypothetical protein WCO06_02950 [Candidatus Roizmanbacteria bacterium]